MILMMIMMMMTMSHALHNARKMKALGTCVWQVKGS